VGRTPVVAGKAADLTGGVHLKGTGEVDRDSDDETRSAECQILVEDDGLMNERG